MGEWIKRNPVLYALINFALCLLIGLFILKIYVDYRVNSKVQEIEQQLVRIEQSTDVILEIIKERTEK